MPLSLYGDYVENDDADDLDTGYLAGIKLGKAKKKGSWQLQYQYEDLEADATLVWLPILILPVAVPTARAASSPPSTLSTTSGTVGATYFDNRGESTWATTQITSGSCSIRSSSTRTFSRCSGGG